MAHTDRGGAVPDDAVEFDGRERRLGPDGLLVRLPFHRPGGLVGDGHGVIGPDHALYADKAERIDAAAQGEA